MKCKSNKIDGTECISRKLKLDDKAKGFWKGIPVCTRCYKSLNENQRRENTLSNYFDGTKKCSKCHKIMSRHSINKFGLCKDCLVKSGTLKRNYWKNHEKIIIKSRHSSA